MKRRDGAVGMRWGREERCVKSRNTSAQVPSRERDGEERQVQAVVCVCVCAQRGVKI